MTHDAINEPLLKIEKEILSTRQLILLSAEVIYCFHVKFVVKICCRQRESYMIIWKPLSTSLLTARSWM